MAVTRRMKIVEELLFNVKNMEFARYASYISESDAVDINEFPHSELYKRYWLDTSNCVMEYQRKNKSVKRMVNKSNIIDTFARYCTLSTSELRKLIRDELTENLSLVRGNIQYLFANEGSLSKSLEKEPRNEKCLR